MKAYLMREDRDFDLNVEPPSRHEDLVRGSQLGTFFEVMATAIRFSSRW